jgi:hypothetical protein
MQYGPSRLWELWPTDYSALKGGLHISDLGSDQKKRRSQLTERLVNKGGNHHRSKNLEQPNSIQAIPYPSSKLFKLHGTASQQYVFP